MEVSGLRPCWFTPEEKIAKYPLDRWLGGLPSKSGRYGEEKILTLPGIETRCPARGPSLYRLSYDNFIISLTCETFLDRLLSLYLRAGRPRGRSSSAGRVKNFLYVVQTSSGGHLASYPMGTGGCFPGGNVAEA
jgi:hypothetical protein